MNNEVYEALKRVIKINMSISTKADYDDLEIIETWIEEVAKEYEVELGKTYDEYLGNSSDLPSHLTMTEDEWEINRKELK